MNRFYILITVTALSVLLGSCVERTVRVELAATNDTHGAIFPKGYTEGAAAHSSLASVCSYMDSLREAAGDDNVILIDCGDHLQGDNATYYFNYVDSTEENHLVSRVFNFMDYDAVVVGNHDLEAGHPVYDRIARELGCPYLAANAVKVSEKLILTVILCWNATVCVWLSSALPIRMSSPGYLLTSTKVLISFR